MGKYIIELEDKPFHKDGDFLYRVKGFNSLVFDMTGIGKLTPYAEPDLEQIRKEAYEEGYKTAKIQCGIQAEKDMREVGERHYQRGLSDARKAMRKIYDISPEDRLEIFPEASTFVVADICDRYSASECIEKIRQYEQEKEEIKVGDEVTAEHGGSTFTVTCMSDVCICGIDSDGRYYSYMVDEVDGKTGNHHEIAAVLEKMRGEQDGSIL